MKAAVGAVLALTLASCAANRAATEPPPPPIVCKQGPDCDTKWSRALSWIATNSRWRIQTQTDLLIQTFNGVEDAETEPGYTITRLAKGAGAFEITFSGGCHNLFACIPSVAEQRAKFAAFVNSI
jgi:hypothetical protein